MSRVMVFRAQADMLERLDVDADTLDEATLKTAHGIYTVFRIYPGRQVLRLDQHLQRMRRSAELMNQPYPVDDLWLRSMTRRAVVEAEVSGLIVPRIRLTIPFDAPSTAYVVLEPFSPPSELLYTEGVAVGLVNAHRDDPRVKSSWFIERRGQLSATQDTRFYELMLCGDDGTILEGTGSNFYGVLDGVLQTAEQGMLPGIARGMVLEVAEGLVPVSLTAVHRGDASRLSEAMLSSATRGIIAIVRIDDQVVGSGTPGPVYQSLRERFEALVERELEPL